MKNPMKALVKSLVVGITLFLSACATNQSGWKPLDKASIDHKSYAIAYSVTGQTYKDRVTRSYDIGAFINGVNDWYANRITTPIEQIQASTLNRMIDHKEYAFYSGVMFAASFQQNVNYLDPNCWGLLHKPSMIQAMNDAMYDLQKDTLRDDQYIRQGADKIIQSCVKTIVEDEAAEKNKALSQ